MRFSEHFEEERAHRRDRRNITLRMCERAKDEPMQEHEQEDGRTVYWGYAPEISEPGRKRYLRVIVLPDRETIWTAHPDRNFRKKVERGDI